MEQAIQKSTNQSIAIRPPVHGVLSKILWHLNQVVAYPMTDLQIEDWARSILELRPDVDLNAVKFLIDKFKTGEREYDSKKGIQNIFVGLKYIRKDGDSYQLMKDPVAVYIPRQEGTNNQDHLAEIDRRIASGEYVKPKQ